MNCVLGHYKVIDSVLSTVDFIFETVPKDADTCNDTRSSKQITWFPYTALDMNDLKSFIMI